MAFVEMKTHDWLNMNMNEQTLLQPVCTPKISYWYKQWLGLLLPQRLWKCGKKKESMKNRKTATEN